MNRREIDEQIGRYAKSGFVIERGAIDSDLAGEMVDHVHWLERRYPDVRPEGLGHGLLAHDPFMWRLSGDNRLLDIASRFIGNDIALFGAHYIAKPPHTGKPVLWHQDGSYWPLEPMEVTTLWVAATDSKRENGCMRVIPGTQNAKLIEKSDLTQLDKNKYVLGHGIREEEIDDSDAIDIELSAGDVSIHNPAIVHGSNENGTDSWRIGLTLRYIPTKTLVNRADHESLLLRGSAEAPNTYAKRPRFDRENHMSFRGCEEFI